MDKKQMTFTVDRGTVVEGEVVEVAWACQGAERVELTIDNGLRTSVLPLEAEGTKRFRLNRSKGRTRLTLSATILDKTYSKTLRVRVKKMPVMKAETLDHNGKPLNALRHWWRQTVAKGRTLKAKEKLRMQQLPEKKQVAMKGMAIIGIVMLLSLAWPRLYTLGMMALMVYFAVVLMKR